MLLLLAPLAAAHVPFARGTTTITEVHAGPAADGGQWFEVRNNTAVGQNLVEQVYTDADGDTFQVTLTLIVRPGAYAVFANAESPVDRDVTLPDGFDLRPDAGAVVHTDLTGVVDEVVWDAGWGVTAAGAHQLDLGVAANEWANDRPANWCPAEPGTGTPGADNARCPGIDTDDDGDGVTEHDGDCDDRDPDVHPGAPDRPPDDGNCDGVREEARPEDTGGADDTGGGDDTAGGDSGSALDSGDSGDSDTADTGLPDPGNPDATEDTGATRPCATGCKNSGPATSALLLLTGLGMLRRRR